MLIHRILKHSFFSSCCWDEEIKTSNVLNCFKLFCTVFRDFLKIFIKLSNSSKLDYKVADLSEVQHSKIRKSLTDLGCSIVP